MKKILSLCLLAIVWFSSVNAQDIKAKDLPKKVKAEFDKLYPNVKLKEVMWHMEGGNYEGKFNVGKKTMAVQISDEGKLVQKTMSIKVTELPKPAQDYLTKNYADVSFDEVSKKTDAKTVITYQATGKGKIVVFDAKGNFVKEDKTSE